MVHVRTFWSGYQDFESRVADWLNGLPQPLDVSTHLLRDGHVLFVGREAESPSIAAALLADQATLAAQLIADNAVQGPPGPAGEAGPAGQPSGAFASKATAQVVVSSVVMVDDAALFVTLPASSRWSVMALLVYDAHATGDVKFSLVGPAGATGVWHLSPQQLAGGGVQPADTKDLGQEQLAAGAGLGVRQSLSLLGHVVVGTGGVLRIRWAQNTANANPTTVHPMSFLFAVRVA